MIGLDIGRRLLSKRLAFIISMMLFTLNAEIHGYRTRGFAIDGFLFFDVVDFLVIAFPAYKSRLISTIRQNFISPLGRRRASRGFTARFRLYTGSEESFAITSSLSHLRHQPIKCWRAR